MLVAVLLWKMRRKEDEGKANNLYLIMVLECARRRQKSCLRVQKDRALLLKATVTFRPHRAATINTYKRNSLTIQFRDYIIFTEDSEN